MVNDETKEGLYFIALGGVGEIGMNLYAYCCDGKWLMVDMGIGFAGEEVPGIDIIMADPAFLEQRKQDIVGLVVTHAHEDHIGAIGYLWSKLKFPVYATPFAAELIEARLDDTGLLGRIDIAPVPLSSIFELGPFEIEFVNVTHSIPEANAIVIRTKYGTIVHSGDWKFDDTPIVGSKPDYSRLKKIGNDGVLAFVCDSTNILIEGKTKSESEVRESLKKIFARYNNRIAVGCFASNVARIDSIAYAARENGRHVCLVGKSLWKVEDAAKAVGYLKNIDFMSEEDASLLPNNKVVYICTGSQGEPGAALLRIAEDSHKHVVLEKGDVVIFSSRVIPGNEKSIQRLHNLLAEQGIEIVTEDEDFVHVSGHPAKAEIKKMYGMIKPDVAIPIHGETRHLIEHEKFAKELGVKTVVRINDGQLIKFSGNSAEIIGEYETGILALDGNRLMSVSSNLIKMRRKMIYNSSAFVSAAIDKEGNIKGNLMVSAPDLIDDGEMENISLTVTDKAKEALSLIANHDKNDDDKVSETIRIAVRSALNAIYGKKPVVNVHLIRI